MARKIKNVQRHIDFKIFAGSASKDLAEKIAKHMCTDLGAVKLYKFSDGEIQPSLEETVRGDFVFIVQSTFPPAENLLELLLMIDAAYRASAYKVVAVIPYFGYARQDRKDKARVPIGAKVVANMLEAVNVSRVITMDLHADQIQGFFDIPLDHLFASNVFIPHLKKLDKKNLVIASPDIGATKRANKYADMLGVPLVICHKARKKANEVAEMRIIGDVKGKDVIIVDDIIDTGGTLKKASELMMEHGARSVRAAITHPVLSGNAYENIENSALQELWVTDTIPLRKQSPKIKVLSVAEHFADIIQRVYLNLSISETFIQRS